MATQLKHTDFAYTPALTPRPNIRVAFIAGEATTAVHDAMAKLPADTRDGTLEDLVWDQGVAGSDDVELIQSMTCALIEKAQELLSPRMYSAFLRWGEAASYLSTRYEADEEGARRCALASAACRALGEVSAEHIHDVILKTLVVGMEAADCSSFGPFANVEPNGELGCQETLLRGLSSDLDWVSPLPALFNELSVRAWDLSGSTSAFSQPIGSAVTSAFSFARGLDSVERETRPVPTKLPAGYNRFMGGPFVQWQRAYETYQDIKTDADRFYKDVVLPAHERFEAVRKKWPTNYDFANDPAAEQEVRAADYVEVEEHGNGLWDQLHDVKMRLYLIPAPSPAELAIKLKLYSENRDGDLIRSNEIVEQMMFDARRFGRHGAHLQADEALLTAYAGLRSDAAGWYAHGPHNDERDDANDAATRLLEEQIWTNRATTLEGVLARLRVTFQHISGEAWSDRAVLDPSHPEFRAGLADAGGNDQMLWAAIEDLARIAGVSLAEQGA